MIQKTFGYLGAALLGLALLTVSALPSKAQQAQPGLATCDLNDDGVTNFLDLYVIIRALNTQEGIAGYFSGKDLNGDGIVNFADYSSLFACFGQAGVNTGTTLIGQVSDGEGNPLSGVLVTVGDVNGSNAQTTTDVSGAYVFLGADIDAQSGKNNEITFDGSGATDPTPATGSGEFPTIPHKPIYVNGGTANQFRPIALPERDLVGSDPIADADCVGGDVRAEGGCELNRDAMVANGGVSIDVPAGCIVQFPANDPTVLSITRIDPAMLPVPMPPELSSLTFVTYQPGGTSITCPSPLVLKTTFDNIEEYAANEPPFLNGVSDGVFSPTNGNENNSTCTHIDFGPNGGPADNVSLAPNFGGDPNLVQDPNDKWECEVNTPFEFAWYHPDRRGMLCLRTHIVGRVVTGQNCNIPVSGATVSIPGIVPVQTIDDPGGANDGRFTIAANLPSIFSIPAGTNGTCRFNALAPRCQDACSNPAFPLDAQPPGTRGRFFYSVFARKDETGNGFTPDEIGFSKRTQAIPFGSVQNFPAGLPIPANDPLNRVGTFPGTPGFNGETNVGDICLGNGGTVRGVVEKVTSISGLPYGGPPSALIINPLAGANVTLNLPFPTPDVGATTDIGGNYAFIGVPQNAPYNLNAFWQGTVVLPGGGTADKNLNVFSAIPSSIGGVPTDRAIDFNGDVDVHNIKFVSTGRLTVNVINGNTNQPVGEGFEVEVQKPNVDLGNNTRRFPFSSFTGTFFDYARTGPGGQVFFTGDFDDTQTGTGGDVDSGIALGPCSIRVFDQFFGDDIGGTGAPDCLITQHGEEKTIDVTVFPFEPGPPQGDIESVKINQALRTPQGGGALIPVIEVTVDFYNPLDNFNRADFTLELDLDQDDTTSSVPSFIQSEIDNFGVPFGPVNLGVDAGIICEFGPNAGSQSCTLSVDGVDISQNVALVGTPFFHNDLDSGTPGDQFPPNGPNTRVIFLIDKADFLAAVGTHPTVTPNAQYNYAFLSEVDSDLFLSQLFFGGFVVDVVPNSGNAVFDPEGVNQLTPDSEGDVFGDVDCCFFP